MIANTGNFTKLRGVVPCHDILSSDSISRRLEPLYNDLEESDKQKFSRRFAKNETNITRTANKKESGISSDHSYVVPGASANIALARHSECISNSRFRSHVAANPG